MKEYEIVWHTNNLMSNIFKNWSSFEDAQKWAEAKALAVGVQDWNLEVREVTEVTVSGCSNPDCCGGEVRSDGYGCTNCGC